MNKQANILFISSSSDGNSARLRDLFTSHQYHQRLIQNLLARASYTQEGLRSLVAQLESTARHAYVCRQLCAAEEAAQVMLALPIPKRLQGAAHYYQGQCLRERGEHAEARRILQLSAETASPVHNARALQAIGASYYDCGEVYEASSFFIAAGKAAAHCDLLTLLESQAMIAISRGVQGDHRRAIQDLEALYPLVRVVGKHHPSAFYIYLNNLAVELGEVDRLEEAKQAVSLALASPFACAHPEWSETRSELEARRTTATSSVVAVNELPEESRAPRPRCKTEAQKLRLTILCPVVGREHLFSRFTASKPVVSWWIAEDLSYRLRYSLNSRAPPLT